jgi:hypothetical protein
MGISDEFRKLLTAVINGNDTKEELKNKLADMITFSSPEEISDDFKQALLTCVKFDLTKDNLLGLLEAIPVKNKDDRAEEELKRLEASINTLPPSDPARKEKEHQMIPLKLKARRWLNKSKPRRIEINKVHRNEQINIVAISAGHQILMCDDEMNDEKEYYLLIPMKGKITPLGPNKDRIYERNQSGLKFEKIIYREWGEDLKNFPLRFVAQICDVHFPTVDTRYSLTFWQEIEREGFFDFWDPERGPMLWHKDHKLQYPHVKILRVFEIDQNLRSLIKPSASPGGRPYLIQHRIEAQAIPILSDEDFEAEYQRLLKILQRYHY